MIEDIEEDLAIASRQSVPPARDSMQDQNLSVKQLFVRYAGDLFLKLLVRVCLYRFLRMFEFTKKYSRLEDWIVSNKCLMIIIKFD